MRAALFAMVLVATSCRSRSRSEVTPDPTHAAKPITHEDVARIVAPAWCAYRVRCGELSRSLQEKCASGSRAPLDVAKLEHRAGRIALDPENAAYCAKFWTEAACRGEVPRRCWMHGGAYRPAVPLGGLGRKFQCREGTSERQDQCLARCVASEGKTCVGWSDCAENDFCDMTKHACRPRLFAGASCLDDRDCVRELTCSNGVCTTPGNDGEPCTFRCARGLECDPRAPHTCRRKLPVGAECAFEFACEDGLICDGSWFSVSMVGQHLVNHGICRPARDIGDTCNFDNDCSRDARCIGKRCAALRAPDYGESCVPGPSPCGVFGHCDEATSKCVPRKFAGERCTPNGADEPCLNGTCDAAARVCVEACERFDYVWW